MKNASRLWKALAAAALMTGLVATVPMSSAGAASVDPVQYRQSKSGTFDGPSIPGNATLACQTVLADPDAVGVKLDRAPGDETWSTTGFSVTLTEHGGGTSFDFTGATPDVLAVIVKGAANNAVGPDTNAFVYPAAVDADTDLYAPQDGQQISHIVFCIADPGIVLVDDLTIEKTVTTSFTRTYPWEIVKTRTTASPAISAGATVNVGYSVDVTKGAGVDSGHTVSGVITVGNSNDVPVAITSLTDALNDDGTVGTCVIDFDDDGFGDTDSVPASIAANTVLTFDYSCTLGATAPADVTFNTARIAWTDPVNQAAKSDFWDEPVVWGDPTTVVNDAVTINDYFDGGSAADVKTLLDPAEAAGTINASRTFTYTRTINVPTSGCATYNNTAKVETTTAVLDESSASVTVCRPNNTGGFTIGYWGNKNGQKDIEANRGAICTLIGSYPNVLGSPDCSTVKKLQDYVKGVLALATSSTNDGRDMLRAQFLATMLDGVKSGPTFLSQTVTVNGSLFTPATANCITISTLLSATNASWTAFGTNKTTITTVKDYFDKINNNTMPLCAP